MKEAFQQLNDETAFEADSAHVRLRLLRVAGGNAELASRLHSVAWEAYCAADCPLGASEKGMLLWLTYGQRGQRQ